MNIKLDEAARIQRYMRTFNTPDGQAVLHDLMRTCGVMQTHNALDNTLLAFREGRRSVVLEILGILEYGPDLVVSAITHASRGEDAA